MTKQNKKCSYCEKKRCDCSEPVLDLIDEAKGYIEGNVRWISKRALRLKSEWAALPPDQLDEWRQKRLGAN